MAKKELDKKTEKKQEKKQEIKQEFNNNEYIRIILLVIIIIIFLLIGFFLGKSTCNNCCNPDGSKGTNQGEKIDPNGEDYVEPEKSINKNVVLPGWGEIRIKANTTNITSGVDFYNPQANEGEFYLKFKLVLNDEVLYESDLVEPGKHIKKITLSKPLKKGEYDAVVFIQPYKMDKKTTTNNGNVKVKLVVID